MNATCKYNPIKLQLLLLLLLLAGGAYAQEPEREDVSVFITVQNVGSFETGGLIYQNDVYLPVSELLSYLHVGNRVAANADTISGVYVNNAPFAVIADSSRIFLGDNVYNLATGDLVRVGQQLFLNASRWSIFGLDCFFNFRSLSVNINTSLELPVMKERRLEQMRQNINKLKNNVKADTSITQSYPLFSLGVADWSVITTQGAGQTQALANLSLGAIVAGGETNITLNYNSAKKFNSRDQYYIWKRINNESKLLKQVMLGKVFPGAISSLYAPVVGFQLSNSPTGFRRSFGNYTLANTARPGETVELYLNNELVDYSKTDASGNYSFNIPMVYGASEVRLKFYGQNGEERTRLENVFVPFNFTPPGSFEYTVTGGVVEDQRDSKYGKGLFSYGLSRRITVGGGVEYLSSIRTSPTIPFVSTSVRLAKGLMLSGEYANGVRSRAILGYRFKNIQAELDYSKYQPGQTAITYNFSEQRKFTLSVPIRYNNLSLFSRLTVNQIILPTNDYTTGEWQLSGSLPGVAVHLSTYGVFIKSDPYLYSNLALTFRLPRNFLITPECQYEYNKASLISVRGRVEKNFVHNGYINLYYEKNFRANFENMGLEFRYDLSFGQVGFSVRKLNNQVQLLQNARGSIRYSPEANYLGVNSHNSLGRGNIIVTPFLDYNNNGIKDKGEPKATGLRLLSRVGHIQESVKDSSIRIFDLEPYSNYMLEFDESSFENISWQLRKKTMSVVVDPNHFKAVNIPISVMSEASGKIYLETGAGIKEQGQILVNFYKDDTTLVGQVMSESDGYFNFFGLYPGEYTVRIDPAQLERLHVSSLPPSKKITIAENSEGSVVENVDFTIERD